ncbi:hypothetical protein ACC718_38400, partial [Rhizobium ruizarguesonis]
ISYLGAPTLARAERSPSPRSARQKAEFLKEWNETLQVIRNISDKLVLDKNRPNWIGPAAPSGAQAEQFLHAHYYQRTFDGRRADYERFFE